MNKIDYQNNDGDFLLQIASLQKSGSILEQAMEKGLFSLLADGMNIEAMAEALGWDLEKTKRMLRVMEKMGLVVYDHGFWCNAPVSAKYLVSSSPFFSPKIFSHGNQSGLALAEKLMPYLEHVKESVWFEPKIMDSFGIQAVSADKAAAIAYVVGEGYEKHLHGSKEDSLVCILGTFEEKCSLNTAVMQYESHLSGEKQPLLSGAEVCEQLLERQWKHTPLISITESISAIFASKAPGTLDRVPLSKEDFVYEKLLQLPVRSVKRIQPREVVLGDWVSSKCRFGCSSYGEKCCPPNSPSYEETQVRLESYQKAYLIEGDPPTRDFQMMMLDVEKIAFFEGFYKAMVLWAGPCSLCTECTPPAPPKKCTATRPSMESSGIDVFATVEKQGYEMHTLKNKTDFVKYFGLLLLE